MPEMTGHPEYQRSLGPVQLVSHGQATKRFVSMIRAMRSVTKSITDRWQQVYEEEGSLASQQPQDDRTHLCSPVDSETSSLIHPDSCRSKGHHSRRLAEPLGRNVQRRKPVPSISEDQKDSERGPEKNDDDDDLEGFIVRDSEPPYGTPPGSSCSSAPPELSLPIALTKTKPFFEPTQFTATQDTNEEDDNLPDVGALLRGSPGYPRSPPQQNTKGDKTQPIKKQREKRRRIVEEGDSDE